MDSLEIVDSLKCKDWNGNPLRKEWKSKGNII